MRDPGHQPIIIHNPLPEMPGKSLKCRCIPASKAMRWGQKRVDPLWTIGYIRQIILTLIAAVDASDAVHYRRN
jgi:hypothetical protein